MDNSKAQALIEKYKSGKLNPSEQQQLEDWYAKLAGSNPLNLQDGELEQNLDDIWKMIRSNTTQPAKTTAKSIPLWKSIAAAAAISIIISAAALYFYVPKQHQDSLTREYAGTGIQPGGNRATLTLADGKVIALDEAVNGKLAEQSGITITKTKDGQVVYTVNDEAVAADRNLINTISTPKGGQYQVNLPDGTRVWLNAGSSLRYPARFSGTERRVALSGEAYFEVTKSTINAKHIPFIVHTDKQDITVLGTHFNVNAYSDEPGIKTTLLEGAVKVSRNGAPAEGLVLKPGQQSSMTGNKLNVSTVNTEEAIAWKNGMFMFKDADLKTVMRTIARWYDVEVLYEGTLPDKEFSGDIYRNLNLSQVLDVLSFYKVHFRVEGKKIIVAP